jgi:hypothetical protein
VIATLSGGWALPASGTTKQRRFASLEEAASALVDAIRAGDQKAMVAIFGDEGRGLVWSGDAVSTGAAASASIAAYDDKHRLEAGGGKVVLVVGSQDFPFPIPIVPDGPSWRFDTAAGKDEIINRRIGQNELNTIQVCLAYVDAQREYYARDPDGDALLQYAQKFASRPESGTGSTGRRSQGSRPARSGRSSPGRAARATPSARRALSLTGATTIGS